MHVFSTLTNIVVSTWFTVFYSLSLSQDLLTGEVLQVGQAGGDTYSVFSTLTQASMFRDGPLSKLQLASRASNF